MKNITLKTNEEILLNEIRVELHEISKQLKIANDLEYIKQHKDEKRLEEPCSSLSLSPSQ